MSVLQLDADLFWRLTPKDIDACFRAWRQSEERWSIRFGVVASAAFNARRRKRDDKVFEWSDFFKSSQPPRIQSPEQMGFVMERIVAIKRANKVRNGKSRRSADQGRN